MSKIVFDKRTNLKIIIGVVIALVIAANAFLFTITEGYSAIVTRFGAPDRTIEASGLHMKLPWPFEKVYTIDMRHHYYDTSFIETLTNDKKNVILQTYVVWSITDPLIYLQSTGTRKAAEANLDSLVTNAKNGILGKYNLSNIVTTDPEEIKLDEIENAILDHIAGQAQSRYGIRITQVGLKRIGLPEVNTRNVFDQMRSERLKFVEQLLAEGKRDASLIRNNADVKAAELEAEGTREAAKIKGKAELEAAQIYANAQKMDPDFYSFLRRLDSTDKVLSEKTTLIFRNDTAPFNVLTEGK